MAPRARRDLFRVRDMGARVALLDERDGRVHLLDPVATALWRRADGELSTAELITSVSDEFGRSVPPTTVSRGLADLISAGVIEHADVMALPRRSMLAAALLAPAVVTVGPLAADAAAAPGVLVCHKGKTIRVSSSAVADHLAHGDTLGACGATTTTSTTPGPTTTSTTPGPTTTSTTPGPTTTSTTTTSTTTTSTTTTSTTPGPTTTSTTPPPTTTSTTPPPTTTSTTPPPTTTTTPAPS